MPLVGLVDIAMLARMHGVDERISIENVGLGARLIYQIIERFAGGR